MITLFYTPGTCATAIHIVLEIISKPYELKKVLPGSIEYKKINPLGSVPAILENNKILTQSEAILTYLCKKYPEANLDVDQDLLSQCHLHHWLSFLTGDLHPSFWPIFSPQTYTDNHNLENLKKIKIASSERLKRLYTYLDNHFKNNKYIIYNNITIADPYLYAMLRWTKYTALDIKDYLHLYNFCSRMEEHKFVLDVLKMEGIAPEFILQDEINKA